MSKKITILVFSGRNSGNCSSISGFISNYHKKQEIKSFQINDIYPCGNCNYECLKTEISCPNTNITEQQRSIMDTICVSDLVYYIIPNYCGFPCASYFAFNERSVGYFNMDRTVMNRYMAAKKRFIIVSNSENEGFKNAAAQQTFEEPDMLYLKSSKYGKQSINGDILESEAAQTALSTFLDTYPLA